MTRSLRRWARAFARPGTPHKSSPESLPCSSPDTLLPGHPNRHVNPSDGARPSSRHGARPTTRERVRRGRWPSLAGGVIPPILALSACTGGGPSDLVSEDTAGRGPATTTLSLYAFSVAKSAFDKLITAYAATAQGQGVSIQQSYGASGDQSRKVAAGASADIVDFSVEPDITRLVDKKLVDADWNAGAHRGIPFGSVVVIAVRRGNPKGIHDWDDLLKPGIQVVTPNPFSSGSAKWNLLAPYAIKSEGGKNPAAGLAYLNELVTQHIKTQPGSGREATESFVQGTGDALLSYENEALFAERSGDPIEHILPSRTFRIDNPLAVLATGRHRAQAQAFVDFVYSPSAQDLLAKAGYRIANASVAARYTTILPTPQKLWTIEDLGGWKAVDSSLFAKGTGSIAAIYEKASS